MEEMLKLQTTYGSNNNKSQSTNPSSLAMYQNSSHVISSSDFKPKIRIVHIFAPEIIKTDVANFRELVQRLTGKPTDRIVGGGGGKKRRRSSTTISSSDNESSKEEEMNLCKKPASTKTTVELCNGFRGSSYVVDQQRIKNEEEEEEEEEEENLWRDGLGDIDGFIQGLTHEYPFLPLMTSSSSSNSHLDAVFGADTYLNLAN